MYRGKSIGVAIATYNGMNYLEEQLNSIMLQTVVPDEIVISDDGSIDGTVDVARRFAKAYQDVVNTIVFTDNPKHGIGGNFEWAIRHSTCDIIFICGQDDVWLPEKVHHVVDVFMQSHSIEMVCHDLKCIDADSKLLPQHPVNSAVKALNLQEGEVLHVSREKFLDAAVSSVIISGPAAVISRKLADKCLPIPEFLPEDWWTQFCGVADDEAYYLNEVLTLYRIHNSATHSASIGKMDKLKKRIRTALNYHNGTYELVSFSKAARKYLDENGVVLSENEQAIRTLDRVNEIGNKVIEAVRSGRIAGAVKLTRLYRTDIRYRRIGRGNYYSQLINILLVSKRKRRKGLTQ